jgi:hypothetical protein
MKIWEDKEKGLGNRRSLTGAVPAGKSIGGDYRT